MAISGRYMNRVRQYKNPLFGRILGLSSATTGSTGLSPRPSPSSRMAELSNQRLNWCYQRNKTGFLALVDR